MFQIIWHNRYVNLFFDYIESVAKKSTLKFRLIDFGIVEDQLYKVKTQRKTMKNQKCFSYSFSLEISLFREW